MRKHSSSSVLTLNKSYTNKTQYSTVNFGLPFPDEEDDAILAAFLFVSFVHTYFSSIQICWVNSFVQKGFLKYHQLQILTCKGNIVLKPVLWYCRLLFNFNHYVDLFFGKTLVLQNKRKPLMRHRRPIICCLFFN